MKYLFVKGCAGLGNRLITILKAIEYANHNNRKLYIDWSDGMFGTKGENMFYRYFRLANVDSVESPEELETIIDGGGDVYPSALTKEELLYSSIYDNFQISTSFLGKIPLYRNILSPIIKGKYAYLLGFQTWHKTKEKKGYFYALKRMNSDDTMPLGGQLSNHLKQKIVLFADFRPMCDAKNLKDNICLREDYVAMFENYALENGLHNAIGVHVRATDKMHNGLGSLFLEIDNLVQKETGLRIFLSTDNPVVENDFKTRYPNQILVYPKYLPQTSEIGIGIHRWASRNNDERLKEQMFLEALADMWLLSMCKYLFWQGNSSFSYISMILKDDKKTTFNWMRL